MACRPCGPGTSSSRPWALVLPWCPGTAARRLPRSPRHDDMQRLRHARWVHHLTTSVSSTANVRTTEAAELERRFGGPKPGDTIVLAMSGGVDSSLCASLLHRAGRSSASTISGATYDLRAVYMRNWSTLDESSSFAPGSGGASGCEWQHEWADVQRVCDHLGGIPLQMIDLSAEYWTSVFEPALDAWSEGQTPNPDVSCNREIKFGALVKRLFEDEDADSELKCKAKKGKAWLATGHYAGIRWERDADGRPHPRLVRCKDANKDQTYYLSSVPESALRLAHFPLIDLLKLQVKELAREHGLPTADRPESMGLCFVGERKAGPVTGDPPRIPNFSPLTPGPSSQSHPAHARERRNQQLSTAPRGFGAFIASYLASPPSSSSDSTSPPAAHSSTSSHGPILSFLTGELLGHHAGLHTFTIGQNARIAGSKSKMFVARKDTGSNSVYVVPGRTHDALLAESCTVGPGGFSWIEGRPPRVLLERDTVAEDDYAAQGENCNNALHGVLHAFAQIRHRQKPVPCRVRLLPAPSASSPSASVQVTFVADASASSALPSQQQQPVVDGVAPGQVVALWDSGEEGGVCLGSGVIDAVWTVWDRVQRERESAGEGEEMQGAWLERQQ
ncbi:5-methylaminomethyl-2-thiouridylate-methyltransferase [Tilletiaria anomala UBC 951]|uniref:tRNA-5-taurinomethyluridine 2-sulfurtransferase n=1 Tax=Tilletiaria anomala (strain ATCC 24038 / CBS 436.72 / UBC 951) TaxID=1037660 RepID=A0A066V341_TILAU|nr:5-methylaminomethyl-2-thiouridylate-methyltransferase [Tilletiaria anomala UBC 951]KDN36132.1 5-methylaminomethyl-2-thiouridylate-methyltransferase [Tilletiaria anomala UBC 951]